MKKTIDSVNLKITENVTQSVKNIDKLSKSIEKLKRLNGGGVGLDKTSTSISRFANSTSKSTAMLSKLTGMFKGASLLKLGITYMTAKKIGETIGGWVNYSKAAQENLNLFTVSMGKNTQKFLDYADEVQAKLGIYKSDFLRNIGLYKKILDGFGVVEDRAVGMSQTLTELSYDISSFFNIPIDTAMEKVQSAMTGELRPLRELGYSFDVATLQQLAYKHGLDVTFDSLTQAEKVMLRYLAITEQSTDVMGDMARTVMTPANMFRILSQQVLQLKENLGNIFIPMLQRTLPYIQAFTRLLTEAAQQLALMAGFKVTDIDYLTDIEMGKDDGGIVSDNDVDNARKIRKLLAPFDEINLLGSNDAISGYEDIRKLFEELTLPSHSGFLAELNEESEKIFQNLKKELDWLEPTLINLIEFVKGFMEGATEFYNNVIKPLFGFVETSLKTLAGSSDWKDIGKLAWHIAEAFVAIKVALGVITAVKTLTNLATALSSAGGILTALNGVAALGVIAIGVTIYMAVKMNESVDDLERAVDNAVENYNKQVAYINSRTDISSAKKKEALTMAYESHQEQLRILRDATSEFKNPLGIGDEWNALKAYFTDNIMTPLRNFFGDYQKIETRANGGFVDSGQLFVAREAGAEMVGSMGGRTAVANNDQIVEGIKQGVMEAMAQSSGETVVKVQLGEVEFGRAVVTAIDSYRRRTGEMIR